MHVMNFVNANDTSSYQIIPFGRILTTWLTVNLLFRAKFQREVCCCITLQGMAFPLVKSCRLFLLQRKFHYVNFQNRSSSNFFPFLSHFKSYNHHQLLGGIRATCHDSILNFDSSLITQSEITKEIRFYRDSRNHYTQLCFSDPQEPYGPPLAVLLPWKGLDGNLLKKLIEFYGEKGFDVLTVLLATEQLLYPCVSGNAMNVVTDLLQHLNETHKHRPYIFHGFSIGVYVFGEILAQFSDQYEVFRGITNNVKGCLWDSPVDFLTVRPYIGKVFYPKNWFNRLRYNMAVKRHFKKHYHDSVIYWLRSRENFCNPIIKIPNVFFVSYTDLLSNPSSLQCVQKMLECNGIPIFQKTWWDSKHGHHFEKYCYEYIHGMMLFFNMSNLFPDECGKYRSSQATASLANIRLRKTARDNFCPE